jgi:hypothetical protein
VAPPTPWALRDFALVPAYVIPFRRLILVELGKFRFCFVKDGELLFRHLERMIARWAFHLFAAYVVGCAQSPPAIWTINFHSYPSG